ncbi:MAG: hypothetical protein PUC18_10005 [Prevotellaceae bacterium]|nr:hypothetical protein [Prevotellaceae bacterium]
MADVSLDQFMIDTIAELQADNCKGLKEDIAFLDEMVSLMMVDLSPREENFMKDFLKMQRLNGIRNYLKAFIPTEN